MKGHHVFRCRARPGAGFICTREPGNPHSQDAILVTLADGTIAGHVPDFLARVLSPLLATGVIQRMEGTVTSGPRSAPEGVWVPGGGIELPCEYVLFGAKEDRKSVRQTLRELQSRTRRKD